MGTWGLGIFDSDDSTDFLVDIVHSEGTQFIEDTINTVLDKGIYIDIRVSYRALVAAYLVRGIITGNYIGLSPDVIEWAKGQNPIEYIALQEKSQQVIRMIRNYSELRDLWKTTPDFESWLKILDDLQLNW